MMLRWRGCALRNVPTLGRRHKTGGRQGGQPCLTDAGDDHFNEEKMNQPDDDDDDIDEGEHDENDNYGIGQPSLSDGMMI